MKESATQAKINKLPKASIRRVPPKANWPTTLLIESAISLPTQTCEKLGSRFF